MNYVVKRPELPRLARLRPPKRTATQARFGMLQLDMPKEDVKIVPQPLDVRPPRAHAGSGAVRTLRLLVIGAFIVPIMIGAFAAYLSYRGDFEHAERGLVQAVAVAVDNTLNVLD